MNLEKSFKIALAMRGKKQTDLAKEMKVPNAYVSQTFKNGSLSLKRLAEVCELLDFKVWVFIKLGEENENI